MEAVDCVDALSQTDTLKLLRPVFSLLLNLDFPVQDLDLKGFWRHPV